MRSDPRPTQSTPILRVLRTHRHTFLAIAALLSIASQPATAQASHPRDPGLQPQLRRALDYLRETEPLTLEEQIRICEIPSPPFQEQARGEYVKKRFVELGLRNVRVDQEGNVIAERPGTVEDTLVVVSAHLDTVFPEGTEVGVVRQGSVLQAPGIGDDSRGLAVMLAVASALEESAIETQGSIVFVATVGEEGLGNLRGVRHLFRSELGERITHFIAIDGTGLDIVSRAVGSHRYRVTFHGAGGHSWKAFGLPSPTHAMGRAIDKISRFRVPEDPKTAYNVGRVGGGTSVNSIAHTAWMEIDLRSENAGELDRLDALFRQAVARSLEEENAFRESEVELTVEIESVGRRPTGNQDDASPATQAAARASAMLGIEAEFVASSTDSNIPISLGIPAVTLRGGGEGTGAHSLTEQFDVTDSHLGTQRVLLTALEIAGVREAATEH